MIRKLPVYVVLLVLGGVLYSGCGTAYYKKSADKEVYKILREKELVVLGKTNSFTVTTPYSARKPQDIKSIELLQQRLTSAKRTITLPDALRIAIESSRDYQLHKETLYLMALTLTKARYDFTPQFFGLGTAVGAHAGIPPQSTLSPQPGLPSGTKASDQYGQLQSQAGFSQLVNSGTKISVTVLNNMLRYYTGDPRALNSTLMEISMTQPLLRGAGADIVAENLTQAERNVIYAIRDFQQYQKTFASGIITTYWNLLQQKDAIRNQYDNYRNLVAARERAEALAHDRLPAYMVDQARQDELNAKSSYIRLVRGYYTTLDNFKITLGLTEGDEISLDDSALTDLRAIGVNRIEMDDARAFAIAVDHRLDVINEIDRFEDSKRQIHVAADAFKPDLNLFMNAQLPQGQSTDYTKFDLHNYQSAAGVQLSLPLNRLAERNAYRTTVINFEAEIRKLTLTLDNTRNQIRQDLGALDQTRQDFQIQTTAAALADRRVDSAALLLQAGRAQMLDVLSAQAAQLAARNAVTQTLIAFHGARLQLLVDLGILHMEGERFWLSDQPLTQVAGAAAAPAAAATSTEVVPPEKLFGKQ